MSARTAVLIIVPMRIDAGIAAFEHPRRADAAQDAALHTFGAFLAAALAVLAVCVQISADSSTLTPCLTTGASTCTGSTNASVGRRVVGEANRAFTSTRGWIQPGRATRQTLSVRAAGESFWTG